MNPQYSIVDNDDNKATSLSSLLVYSKLAQSKREARKFIEDGAVRINDTVIGDVNYTMSIDDFLYDKYCFLRRGKHQFFALILK